MTSILSSMLTSAGLGLGAGVNAYATFLVFGGLARLYPSFFEGDVAKFFATTPVLIAMGVFYTIEFFADKIPAIDHAWDLLHTFIRPVAGAVVAFAAVSDAIPQPAVIIASAIGGSAALGAHAAKATLRAGSTLTTAGTANPFISIVEDLFVFVNSLIAIFIPYLVILSLLLLVLLSLFLYRRFRPAS